MELPRSELSRSHLASQMSQTPETRLTAALEAIGHTPTFARNDVGEIFAADPTIAADLNDAPRLRAALRDLLDLFDSSERWPVIERARAALTEGSGE